MHTSRSIARILYYLSRMGAWLFTLVLLYTVTVLVLSTTGLVHTLPIEITKAGSFTIFYPFTRTAFLLGEYTTDFIVSRFTLIAFYTLFIWLLGDVFHAFRQQKLFTPRGVSQLTRFYITNLALPVLFLLLVGLFGEQLSDMLRIGFLHIVIGVFAYFMASIFKQGLVLQEEQDLTF
jgi:hypothetical protein